MATPVWGDFSGSLGSLRIDSMPRSMPSGPLSSRLDQQLSCAICLERYDDPRILKCSHSFCRRCLVRVLEGRLDDPECSLRNNELMCPKCRNVTVLSDRGVDALPINFDLLGVVELFDEDDPLGTSSQPSISPNSTPTSLRRQASNTNPYCPDHNRVLDFFCEECDKLMCATCAVKQRCGHQTKEAKEVTDEIRSQCVEPLNIRYLRTNVAIDENARMSERLRLKAEEHKRRIHTTFQEIRNSLSSREFALVTSIDGIVNKKRTALHAQCLQLQQIQEKLRAERDHVASLLNIKNNDFNILLQRRQIVTEVDSVITEADKQERDPVEDVEEGPVCYLAEGLLREANLIGEVYCTPCPGRFVASGAGLEKGFVGVEAKFVVEAHDKYGQRAFKGGNSVTVEITGPSGAEISASVESTKRGEYTVKYTPLTVGYHTVRITADGQNISNYETHIVVYGSRDYSTLAKPCTSLSRQHITDMSTVRSVCPLSNGRLVFSDQLCLRAITLDGRLVRRAIGTYGIAPGQFNMPVGVTTNSRDEIYVADRQNHRVQKLSSEGKFLMAYGGVGSRPGSLMHPEGVAIAGERLFVVDTGNHRIQVFHQKTGKTLGAIGGKGGGLHLLDPQGIAVDEERGRLFITDSGNNRLIGLSLHTANIINNFGQNGEVPLINPTSVAVDMDGFILVTSSKAHLLTVLSPQGAKVKQLGSDGMLFKSPYGICVDSSGNVVVTDTSMPPRIHIF